jgi:lysyl-tRNA synthetase class 2
MELTKELVAYVATQVNGTTKTRLPVRGLADPDISVEIDLAPEKWQQMSMREAIIKFWPISPRPTMNDLSDAAALTAFLQGHAEGRFSEGHDDALFVTSLIAEIDFKLPNSPSPEPQADFGKTIAAMFEFVAEEHLQQPTIIYDFPLAVSPLSKIKPDEPDWVERFEFYIGGFEVGNAFSELNDPDDQRARFEAQLKERERGDDEAHQMDEDYVRALGYGLPPTAGEGIGIDRLTMILTGAKSIRDVILFPLLRPQGKSAAE